MSQTNGNGNGRGDDRREDDTLAVRIAKEVVGALQVKPRSVEGVEQITAWPLLTAVVAVAIAKCEAIRRDVLLAFIATEHNMEGTPAAEVFATMELSGDMRGRDLLVRVAAATIATMIFDEMQIRLGERAGGGAGSERPALKAVPGGGERAAG